MLPVVPLAMNLTTLGITRRTARSPQDTGVPASAALRARVFVRRATLDRALAAGAAYDHSQERALRAGQLTALASRRRLARLLRDEVAAASRRRAASLDHDDASSWDEALLGVAERLERPGAPSVKAIARVRLLLSDAGGPLHGAGEPSSLREAVWGIADAMAQPCPPHKWRCPVIMKVDPDHVAWTCARCGTMRLSHDVALQPE